MQRANHLKTAVCLPSTQSQHNLSQFASKASDVSLESCAPLSVLLAAQERVCVTLCYRHELRSFDFEVGRIGMEVEAKYNRLMCTSISPDSQADAYLEQLLATEIIAVNGHRVVSIDDFQTAVIAAYEYGRVTITAACYKKGKAPVANFYASLMKRKTNVKSLFGGLLSGGIDLDHQHDIQLPTGGDSDDDTATADESSVATAGESSVDNPGGETLDAEQAADATFTSSIVVTEYGADSKDASESKEYQTGDKGGYSYDDGESDDDAKAEAKAELNFGEDSDSDDSDGRTSIRMTPAARAAKQAKAESRRIAREEARTRYEGAGDDDDGMIVAARREAKQQVETEPEAEDVVESEQEDEYNISEKSTRQQTPNTARDVEEDCAVVEDSRQAELDKLAETWDFDTVLDVEETVPYKRVVCVPKSFQKSAYWGDPDNFMEIINYSSVWDIQLCWVDEEGGLVPRVTLKSDKGACKHMELTNTSHLWAIVATINPSIEEARQAAVEEASITEATAGSNTLDQLSGSLLPEPGTGTHAPVIMMFRCSKASLQPRKYTSVIWTPWSSLSATQRMHPKEVPEHHRGGQGSRRDKHTDHDPQLRADIKIQVMDSRG